MDEGSELLKALQPQDRELLLPKLSEVRLETGRLLFDPGDVVDYCYFPIGSAVASYFVLLDTGVIVETLMVGREGALGGIVSNGSLPAYARSVVMHGELSIVTGPLLGSSSRTRRAEADASTLTSAGPGRNFSPDPMQTWRSDKRTRAQTTARPHHTCGMRSINSAIRVQSSPRQPVEGQTLETLQVPFET